MYIRPNQYLVKQQQIQAELSRRSMLFRQIIFNNDSKISYQLVISTFNFNKMILSGEKYSFSIPYSYQAQTSCQLQSLSSNSNQTLNFILNPNGEIILADPGLQIATIVNGVLGDFVGYDELENNCLIISNQLNTI